MFLHICNMLNFYSSLSLRFIDPQWILLLVCVCLVFSCKCVIQKIKARETVFDPKNLRNIIGGFIWWNNDKFGLQRGLSMFWNGFKTLVLIKHRSFWMLFWMHDRVTLIHHSDKMSSNNNLLNLIFTVFWNAFNLLSSIPPKTTVELRNSWRLTNYYFLSSGMLEVKYLNATEV